MSVKRGNAYIMINRYQEHQGLFNSDEMATNGAIRRTPFKECLGGLPKPSVFGAIFSAGDIPSSKLRVQKFPRCT